MLVGRLCSFRNGPLFRGHAKFLIFIKHQCDKKMLLLMVPKTLHHPWIRIKPNGYHQQYLVHCVKSFCKVRLNLLLSIFNFDLVDIAHRDLEHEPTIRNGFSCRDVFPKDPDPSLEEDSGFQSHPLNRNVEIIGCFQK